MKKKKNDVLIKLCSFAGWLYDYTLSYGPGFIMAGTTIAISGAMLFAIPSLQRYLARRRSAAVATVAIPLE